jgi:hypothetical protein
VADNKSRKIIVTTKVMTATELYLMRLGISPRPLIFQEGRTSRKNRSKIVG